MLVLEVFISEFLSVDALTSSSILACEVSSLSHEAWDDSMEGRPLEVERPSRPALSFLSCAESTEVL